MIKFPISKDGYLIGFPKGFDEKEKYPLVLFFHGLGGKGNGTAEGLKSLDTPKELPAGLVSFCYNNGIVLFAAQTPNSSWSLESALRVKEIAFSLPCVNDKKIITGLSMGGGAVKRIMTHSVQSAKEFVAAIDVCGVGGGTNWKNVADAQTPYRLYHAKNDSTVTVNNSINAATEMEKHGHNNVMLTIYDKGGHSIWNKVYEDLELQKWMLNVLGVKDVAETPEMPKNNLKADFTITEQNRIYRKFDASISEGAISYKWEIVSEPKNKDYDSPEWRPATKDAVNQGLTYLSRGQYTVRLTVIGSDGRSAFVDKSFTVK